MSETRHCTECGAELPSNAPQGLCPRCLMKVGAGPDSGADSGRTTTPGDAPTSPTPTGRRFVPPDAAALGEQFPSLEIFELLGQGGMGAVYKARQVHLDRTVALKILPPEVSGDPAFAERFTREARSLAKLNHPHIVGVYDSGKTEAGLFYFIMEFVDGTDLRYVMQSGELSPSQALAIVPQICDALQFAHDAGIIHRDIKPENILLDKNGNVKIVDFGLGKILGTTHTDHLTGTRDIMGTPHYMAPEQIESPRDVDHRADIYALGVVFYEMLTGELPLGRFAPPSEKVRIDVRLDEVVLRTLEKEPERRYQKASDVGSDVQRIESDKTGIEDAKVDAAVPSLPQDTNATDVNHARQALKRPAIGLVVAGVVDLAMLVVAVAFITVASLTLQDTPPGTFSYRTILNGALGAGLLVWSVPWGILRIAAGMRLRSLRSLGLTRFLCFASLLPFTPGALIGLPMGIWALVVLGRPEVQAAFELNSQTQVKPPGSTPPRPSQSAANGDIASPPMKSSRWAILSLIFGILALPLSILSGIPAVVSGILALNSIGRHRGRLGGKPLAVAGMVFGALSILLIPYYLIVAGTVVPNFVGTLQAPVGPTETIRAYSATDATIAQDGVERHESGWRLTAAEETVFRLFEQPLVDIGQSTLTFRAQVRSENLKGDAYLAMWCRFPGRGEFFSRGLAQTISGTTEWATYETPFYLKAGEAPDLIKLNFVTKGAGTVYIKNIELLRTPLSR